MIQMENEGEVYFKLFGERFDPHSLSSEIGIDATRIRIKDDPIPKHSMWIYSSGMIKDELIDVYEMASSIVSILSPFTHEIKTVMNKYSLKAVLEVVLTVSPEDSISTPAIGFDSEVIAFINSVGATIDIDTYRG